MSDLTGFIERLPKCELHMHVEGSLEPELMFQLAARNGVTLPYPSVEALRSAYSFTRLQDFLDLYYQGMSVLRTEEDFHDLAAAYLARVHAQGLRHVEMFFDPQAHISRGIAIETVLGGLQRALDEARETKGITSHLIMCFLRHLDEAEAEKTLDLALPHKARIIGIEGDEEALVQHALQRMTGHVLDDAKPEIGERADRQRNPVAGQAGGQRLVLQRAVAVIDTIDPEQVDRLPDIVGRPFLAGMGHEAEACLARALEDPGELARRMAQLGGI